LRVEGLEVRVKGLGFGVVRKEAGEEVLDTLEATCAVFVR
jgi:hypothetical protein